MPANPRSVVQTPASPVPSTGRSVRSSVQSATPGHAGTGAGSPGWQSVGSVQVENTLKLLTHFWTELIRPLK